MRIRLCPAIVVVASFLLLSCKSGADSDDASSESGIVGLMNPGVVTGSYDRAQRMTAQVELANVYNSIQMFWALEGRPPTTLDELVTPSRVIEEIPIDPWGRPYGYELTGPDTFRLYSFGPDGRPGSDDDILWGE